MANISIPNLPVALSLSGNAQLMVVQGNTSYSATVQQVAGFNTNSGTVTSITAQNPLSGGTITTTGTIGLNNNGVTNDYLAQMGGKTLKGNNSSGSLQPLDLTVAQVMTMLAAAPLNSPNFTGTPTAPTALTVDNSTQIATTAFVKAQNFGFGSVTSITAGTGLSGGTITTTGTIAIANTGVTAQTYGTASAVPQIIVNAQGQITSASNVTISIVPSQVVGLGTMATQNANAVAITGGTIDQTTIGGTTKSAGSFTNLTATGTVSIGTISSGTWQGTPVAILYGGTGATTASGARTNLSAASSGANSDITSLSGLTTPLSETQGGTGYGSYTTGDILYASSSSTLARLNDVAIGNVLLSGGVGVAPSWGKVSLSSAITGTLPTSNGGTGLSGATPFTSGGAVYASSASALTTGTLPVTAGGTGVTTSTGTGSVVLSNSPTLITPAIGTPSSAVLTNATGLPLTTGIIGILGTPNGGTGLSVFTSGGALYATSTSVLASGTLPVTAGGTGVTTSTGTGSTVLSNSPTFVTPNLGTPSTAILTSATGLPLTTGVTGVLPVANGGTGASTLSGYVFGNGTGAFTASATIPNAGLTNSAITLGTTSVSLGATAATLSGLTTVTVTQDPVSALQLSTKQYVDGQVATVSNQTFHTASAAATTANLTATYNNGSSGVGATLTNSGVQAAFSTDGYTASLNDRILVKDMTTSAYNGIYTVTTVGTILTNWVLTRATDFNTVGTGPNFIETGAATFVTNGTTYGATSWVMNTTGTITVGSTSLVWAQTSASGNITVSAPITKTGSTIGLSTVGISFGGTGQTTASAAFNALSPITTTGDLILGNGASSATRLGIGTNNQILTSNGTTASWVSGINGTVGATTPSTGAFTYVTANGSIASAAAAGAYSYGTLGYTDTNTFASYTNSVNSYNQMVLQNTNSGTLASTDFIVSNNNGTASTYFGDFGMNSSGFSGTGALNTPNNVFLTSTSVDLAIGTTTSNAIHFVVNNGATDAMTIGTSGAITAGTWNGSTIGTGYGGTGLTTFTAANNAIYSTSSSALIAGTLPVLAGGTGVTTSTGSGSVVLSTSPTLVTPALGTPSAAILTNATGLPLTTGITGTLGVTNGGTGTNTSFTTGSVVFAGASGVYSQNNAKFFWDNTNNRIGINTAAPQTQLTIVSNTQTTTPTGTLPAGTDLYIVGANAANTRITQDAYGTGSYSAFTGRQARGTAASPTASQTGDFLSQFTGRGYGATIFGTASTGYFALSAAENFTDTAQGTYASVYTTATGGNSATEAFRFGPAGQFGIGAGTYGTSGQFFLSGGPSAAPTWTTVTLATLSGVVPVASGGTNITSYTVGDLLYASAATTLSKLSDVATGSVLVSGGVGNAPSYSASPTLTTSLTTPLHIGGTTTSSTLTLQSTSGVGATDSILFKTGNNGAVTALTIASNGNATFLSASTTAIGTLSLTNALTVANGGTGAATFTANGVIYGNGTSALGVTGAGTTGQVLVATTGSAPTWGSVPTTAAVTSITFGTTGLTPSSATTGAVTVAGTLVAANGGTGQSSYTIGDLLYASSSTALSKLADVATGSVLVSGGVGAAPAYSATPTLTSLTAPSHFGGTLASSSLTLQSTTGVGTTDSILFKTGNNGAVTALTIASNGNATFLSTSTTAIGTLSLTNALTVANGGTGQSSYTIGDLLYASTTTALSKLADVATGSVLVSGGVGVAPSYSASPTLTTSLTTPLLIGGTAASSTLTLESTSGAGTTDSIIFKTGSQSERMRIDTSGNVGIGTTSPTEKLTVSGNVAGVLSTWVYNTNTSGVAKFLLKAGTQNTAAFSQSATDGAVTITTDANAPMLFNTNATERMRIDSSGNVGIGTSSPNSRLQVTGVFTPAGVASYPAILGGGAYGGGIGFQDSTAVSGIYTQSAGTQLLFFTGQTSADTAASKVRMTIDGSGNVGIGTTSPSTYGKFAVVGGDGNGVGFFFGATGGMRLGGYNSAYSGSSIEAVNAAQSAYQPMAINGSYTVLATGGTERMRIDSSGNVLIPSVYSSTSATAANVYVNSSGQLYRATASATASGTLIRAPQILTSGTSYTTPAGCNSIYVEVVGGGGSGGNKAISSGASAGGGGGGYSAKYFTVSPSTAYAYAIGAGGTAVSVNSTNGNSGGNTTFTGPSSVTITGGGGGGGGQVASFTFGSTVGGASGIGSGGDLNIRGSGGTSGFWVSSTNAIYGNGGGSYFGGGSPQNDGAAGNTYGGGGAGGGSGSGSTSSGAGAAGVIRVWEYT